MTQFSEVLPEGVPDRALLAAIVESTDDAIVSVDGGGRITSWNRGAEDLYRRRAADAVGRPMAILFRDEGEADDLLRRILAGERISHGEVRRICGDGAEVTVGETVSPLHGHDGAIVGAATVSHDVGSRLEVEAVLAAAHEELEVQNRQLARSNAELEQFAYVASHDLSEPLRAVAGMVGLLARRYKGRLDSDADEFIDFAISGCERMRAMIEDLLAFSRAGRSELHLRPVPLAEVVAAAVAGLGQQIEAVGASIEVGDLPEVEVDPTQLSQVLQNLLSNALKFHRPGLAPTVTVTADRLDGEGGWRVQVADDGIGVDEQYQEKIFRMFQRLHPSDAYPGTGIGLAIAERIIDRHGGTMGVMSDGESGSTFWFTIPDDAGRVPR